MPAIDRRFRRSALRVDSTLRDTWIVLTGEPSLAMARAITFVCVVSLGIGMALVIAIPYGARILRLPPPGVNTEGLVELVTSSRGPPGRRRVVLSGPRGSARPGVYTESVPTMFVSANYFRTIGVTLARGPGFDAAVDDPLTAALALTRWMRSLLFEVSPSDPVTFVSVAALLGAVALAACYVPARRAMKADVVGLLR